MLLLFFMDGVKYDMMKKYMPFLSMLNSKPLIGDFGYSCACHATMYTSRYIEEHQTWFIWKKGDRSPYKWINYIPGLKYINFLPLKLIIGKITNKFSKNTSYSGVPCLVNLPLKYWPLFELSETVLWNDSQWKKYLPNMFTILQQNNILHHIVALHKGTQANDAFIEEKKVNYAENEFIYYFIGYTDNIMHKYGENAIEAQQYLKKVDEFIKNTYLKVKSFNDDVTVIAYSDHGHIDIEEPKIDINKYFKMFDTNVNAFIHLIESNYARFWFRNDKEKDIVLNIVQKMEDEGLGFVLNQKYLNQYHLNLNKEEQGHLIFYLQAPKEFTNTIWGFGKSVKSGHGFEPTLIKHHGIFCTNKNMVDVEFAYLVDILPTVMANLNVNLDNIIIRGKNLLK